MTKPALLNPALAALVLLTLLAASARAETAIQVSTPMPPPAWAFMERTLLEENMRLMDVFVDKYVDPSNGYQEIIEHWGGADGPDDAMESFYNWPLVYILGGPGRSLELFRFVWDGHIRQYTEAGMYYREFITSFDWEHNGEGLEPFLLLPLADPYHPRTRERTVRFANFYTGRDETTKNYDPKHKIIRSILNGSKGPKLEATPLDWGEPPGDRYFRESGDWTQVKGDVPINLLATSLPVNAYILTGDHHYRDWVLEYTEAWRQRTMDNGGNIPSIVGLNGKVGEGWDGKWYGGLMGWNWVFGGWGILGRGPRIGFSNAILVGGGSKYLDALRSQGKNLLDNRVQTDDGPRFYNQYGDQGWHQPSGGSYFEALYSDIYLTSLDERDLKNLYEASWPPPAQRRNKRVWKYEYEDGRFEGGNEIAWIDYLEGDDPDYPVRALGDALERIRRAVTDIRSDPSTPDTRQADTPHIIKVSEDSPRGVIGVAVGALTNLTLGARHPHWSGGLLYSELRYFDPARRRAGLPLDVSALVTGISREAVKLTLVNLNQTDATEVIVQCGAYGEHRCEQVEAGGESVSVKGRWFRVELAPGAGGELTIQRTKYANQPTFAFPWKSN